MSLYKQFNYNIMRLGISNDNNLLYDYLINEFIPAMGRLHMDAFIAFEFSPFDYLMLLRIQDLPETSQFRLEAEKLLFEKYKTLPTLT